VQHPDKSQIASSMNRSNSVSTRDSIMPSVKTWPFSGRLGLLIIAFWVVVAVVGPWLIPERLMDMSSDVFEGISAAHVLGTDYLGRDMLARLIQGAGYTMGVALLATCLACLTGLSLGLLAAVLGGPMDSVLSRSMDTLVSIPSKMFALVVVAAFGSSLPLLVLTAAVVYTPGAYRIARALAVNLNAMDFVTVSRIRGEKKLYIMFQEILPGMKGPLLADMGLRFIYVVLLMASLGFLGLGVQPPDADWGSLVRENIGALATGGISVVGPALAIASLTIAVNLVVDNLPSRNEKGGQ
jgi:peptide/nickel transport system permease protein